MLRLGDQLLRHGDVAGAQQPNGQADGLPGRFLPGAGGNALGLQPAGNDLRRHQAGRARDHLPAHRIAAARKRGIRFLVVTIVIGRKTLVCKLTHLSVIVLHAYHR